MLSIRYPYVCCELVISLAERVSELLASEPGILEVFWTFMQDTPRIDLQVFVHMTRILAALLTSSPRVVFAALRERGHVFDLFIKHLDTTAAADFLCRLIEMESSTHKILHFLDEELFFYRLMQTIGPERTEAEHFALAQFVSGLMNRAFPESYPVASLVHRFTDPRIFQPFLAMLSDEDVSLSAYHQGINVISTLCVKIHQVATLGISTSHLVAELTGSVLPKLLLFNEHLEGPKDYYSGPTGLLQRVGIRRMKAARLFADLAILSAAALTEEMRRLETAERMFSLFFTHSHNSFIQNTVADFFSALCHGDWAVCKPIIVGNIFRGTRLLSKITQAQRIADSYAEMPRKPRPNFMGHITLLADQVHLLMEKHGAELYKEMGDLLRKESWIEYSNKSYRETKLKDAFILGGEQAPTPQVPTEEIFTSVFSTSADEAIVRYFCHEIIANFPPGLHLTDLDDFCFSEEDELVESEPGIRAMSPQGILGGTLLGNRGAFDDFTSLELELRLSTLDDDDFDLGPDSEDDADGAYGGGGG